MTDKFPQIDDNVRRIEANIAGLNHQSYLIKRQNELQLLLTGRTACWQARQKKIIRTLADVEFRVSSQWGEDGIIDWLVESIPITNTTFVEFGVENYQEANTRFLLQNRNWRGLVMDGNPDYMASVRQEEIHWRYDIQAVTAFITRDNINNLLTENGIVGDIGLLSIDIDGNDYWVLDAISAISPRILVCEYNPILGDLHAITVPYNPEFDRLKAHHCGLYFGASIKAICELARKKGYKFVGSCSNGINAFFVRNDLFDSVFDKIEDKKAYSSRHRDARDEDGNLIYVAGAKRSALFKNMPVVDISSDNKVIPIEELGVLYSQEWLDEMC